MRHGTGARRVTILGLTFKENVPDIRNSKIVDIVNELRRFDIDVEVADPLADAHEVEKEFGIRLRPIDELRPAEAVILGVAHRSFVEGGWDLVRAKLDKGAGIVLDIKSSLDRDAVPAGITLWRL